MREVQLTNGGVAIVDDEDFELVSRFKWHRKTMRQIEYVYGTTKVNRQIMHRLILSAPPGVHVDHVNGNGLDNRRSNLRLADRSQNQANRFRLSLNTSGYRGVCFHRQSGKWQAGIKIKGRSVHLGLFETPELAAAAYDSAARELFGEFARPNAV